MSIRGPRGAPLFGTTGPQLCSAAGAKWVLATLPWLELSLFPHQLSADIHSHGGSEWNAATFVKHPVAALMGKQTSLQLFSLVSSLSSPPLNRSSTTPRPLVGGFDNCIMKVWEVLLLSFTSFRVFDSQLTFVCWLLICKQQLWFAFIAPLFSLMPEVFVERKTETRPLSPLALRAVSTLVVEHKPPIHTANDLKFVLVSLPYFWTSVGKPKGIQKKKYLFYYLSFIFGPDWKKVLYLCWEFVIWIHI